jgi:hypothetical protein
MIKLKNILAENMLRFGTKNLNESTKQKLIESGSTEPGDPSQSTVDLSDDFRNANSALQTYADTYNALTKPEKQDKKPITLSLITDPTDPNNLLITGAGRATAGDAKGKEAQNYIFKYNMPTQTLTRRLYVNNQWTTKTIASNPQNIGSGPDGIWRYGGATSDKNVQAVKNAADKVGNAVITLFYKIRDTAPKGSVEVSRHWDEFKLGTPEQRAQNY